MYFVGGNDDDILKLGIEFFFFFLFELSPTGFSFKSFSPYDRDLPSSIGFSSVGI
jgi:hypothetical protein